MDRGLLDKSSLSKTIRQIEFYSEEEKKSLAKIYSILKESSNSYKAQNANLFLKNCELSEPDIGAIFAKRRAYVDVLIQVIHNYEEMGAKTVTYFDGGTR